MRRLPLGPADVLRVARAAGACEATVRRWLHGHDGHRCQDAAIVAALVRLDLHPARLDPMAAATLPPVAQVELPVDISVDGRVDNPPASPRDDAGNCGQSRDIIADITNGLSEAWTNDVHPLPRPLVIGVPLPPEMVARLNGIPPRRRLTVILDDKAMTVDELAEYAEHAEGAQP